MSDKNIVCFGEVLWDLLPSGKIAGGAPMNVAVHANQLGLKATMISTVGNDELGQEIRAFLEDKNCTTDFLQTDNQHPTGKVNVFLSLDTVQDSARPGSISVVPYLNSTSRLKIV